MDVRKKTGYPVTTATAKAPLASAKHIQHNQPSNETSARPADSGISRTYIDAGGSVTVFHFTLCF